MAACAMAVPARLASAIASNSTTYYISTSCDRYRATTDTGMIFASFLIRAFVRGGWSM
jgi:hypothetical protein